MSDETTWHQQKFNEVLQMYSEHTRRTGTQIVNTKLWYIVRRAQWNTRMADSWKIQKLLGGVVTKTTVSKKGRIRRKKVSQLVWSKHKNAPLAALIVNARQRAAGKKGFYGRKMERAIVRFFGARMKSIGFLKVGYLPAIRALGAVADRADKGGAPEITSVKQRGREKGTATVAQESDNPQATAANLATTRRDHKGALIAYGQEALAQAFAEEQQDTMEYIRRKLIEPTEKANAGLA